MWEVPSCWGLKELRKAKFCVAENQQVIQIIHGFLELIIPKKDKHPLGVRATTLLLEKTKILNTGLIKQLATTLGYTSSTSLPK